MNGYDAFQQVDIRVGKIISVEDFPQARKPSYKLQIDLGPEIGIKKSCGQFVAHYTKEQLMGKLVICLINIEPRQIGPAVSEVLTLGVPGTDQQAVLLSPTKDVPLGGKLF